MRSRLCRVVALTWVVAAGGCGDDGGGDGSTGSTTSGADTGFGTTETDTADDGGESDSGSEGATTGTTGGEIDRWPPAGAVLVYVVRTPISQHQVWARELVDHALGAPRLVEETVPGTKYEIVAQAPDDHGLVLRRTYANDDQELVWVDTSLFPPASPVSLHVDTIPDVLVSVRGASFFDDGALLIETHDPIDGDLFYRVELDDVGPVGAQAWGLDLPSGETIEDFRFTEDGLGLALLTNERATDTHRILSGDADDPGSFVEHHVDTSGLTVWTVFAPSLELAVFGLYDSPYQDRGLFTLDLSGGVATPTQVDWPNMDPAYTNRYRAFSDSLDRMIRVTNSGTVAQLFVLDLDGLQLGGLFPITDPADSAGTQVQASGDLSAVAFGIDRPAGEDIALVDASGAMPGPVRIIGGTPFGALGISLTWLSDDGSRIFWIEQTMANEELFYADTAVGGMARTQVSPATMGTVWNGRVGPGGNSVVWLGQEAPDTDRRLRFSALDGTEVTELSEGITSGQPRLATFMEFSPDGTLVLFDHEDEADRIHDLYVTDVSTPDRPRFKVTEPDQQYQDVAVLTP